MPFFEHVLRDDGVVGQLHLIDRHRVRFEFDRALDRVAPLLFRFAHHAGDQIDVDLREIDFARPLVSAIDLRREMRAAIRRQDLVVEMFDTEAQPRDADLFERFELRFLQRARLTLEGDFFGILPTHVTIETIDQIMQLLFADVRRRAAAEVSEPELPPLKSGHAAVDFILFDQRVEIDLDLGCVLVRVDFEVTEVAALAAERDVNVKTERIFNARRLVERLEGVSHKLRLPLRERRIIRDKIIADFGSGLLSNIYSHWNHSN